MKIQYFKSKSKWFFRIRAKNGRIIAQSEGYNNKASCLKTVGLFRPLGATIEKA